MDVKIAMGNLEKCKDKWDYNFTVNESAPEKSVSMNVGYIKSASNNKIEQTTCSRTVPTVLPSDSKPKIRNRAKMNTPLPVSPLPKTKRTYSKKKNRSAGSGTNRKGRNCKPSENAASCAVPASLQDHAESRNETGTILQTSLVSVHNDFNQDISDKSLEILSYLNKPAIDELINKVMKMVVQMYGSFIYEHAVQYLGLDNYQQIENGVTREELSDIFEKCEKKRKCKEKTDMQLKCDVSNELKYLSCQEVLKEPALSNQSQSCPAEQVLNNNHFDNTVNEIALKLNKIGTFVKVVNSTDTRRQTDDNRLMMDDDDVGQMSAKSFENHTKTSDINMSPPSEGNHLIFQKNGPQLYISQERAIINIKNNEVSLKFDPDQSHQSLLILNDEDVGNEFPISSTKSVCPSAREEYNSLSELLNSTKPPIQSHFKNEISKNLLFDEMTKLNTDTLVGEEVLKQGITFDNNGNMNEYEMSNRHVLGAREPQPVLFEDMFDEVNEIEKIKKLQMELAIRPNVPIETYLQAVIHISRILRKVILSFQDDLMITSNTIKIIPLENKIEQDISVTTEACVEEEVSDKTNENLINNDAVVQNPSKTNPDDENNSKPSFDVSSGIIVEKEQDVVKTLNDSDTPKNKEIPAKTCEELVTENKTPRSATEEQDKENILTDHYISESKQNDVLVQDDTITEKSYIIIKSTIKESPRYFGEIIQIQQHITKISDDINAIENKENISTNKQNTSDVLETSVKQDMPHYKQPKTNTNALEIINVETEKLPKKHSIKYNPNDDYLKNTIENVKNVSDASDKNEKISKRNISDDESQKNNTNTPRIMDGVLDKNEKPEKCLKKNRDHTSYKDDYKKTYDNDVSNKNLKAQTDINASENIDKDNNNEHSIKAQYRSDDGQKSFTTSTPKDKRSVSDALDISDKLKKLFNKKKIAIDSIADQKKTCNSNVLKYDVEIHTSSNDNQKKSYNNDVSNKNLKVQTDSNTSENMVNVWNKYKRIRMNYCSSDDEQGEINTNIPMNTVPDVLDNTDKTKKVFPKEKHEINSDSGQKKTNDNVFKNNLKMQCDTNPPIKAQYSSDDKQYEINTNKTKKLLKNENKVIKISSNLDKKKIYNVFSCSNASEGMAGISLKNNKSRQSNRTTHCSSDGDQNEINTNRRKTRNMSDVLENTGKIAKLSKKKNLHISSDADQKKIYDNDLKAQIDTNIRGNTGDILDKNKTKKLVKTDYYSSADEYLTVKPASKIMRNSSDVLDKNDKTRKLSKNKKINISSDAAQKKIYDNDLKIETDTNTSGTVGNVSNKSNKQEKGNNDSNLTVILEKLENNNNNKAQYIFDDEQVKTPITGKLKNVSNKYDEIKRDRYSGSNSLKNTVNIQSDNEKCQAIASDVKKVLWNKSITQGTKNDVSENRENKPIIKKTLYSVPGRPKKTRKNTDGGSDKKKLNDIGVSKKKSMKTDSSCNKSASSRINGLNGNYTCEISYGTQDEDDDNKYRDVKEMVHLSSDSAYVQIDGQMFNLADFIGGVLAPPEPKQDMMEPKLMKAENAKKEKQNTSGLNSAQLKRKVLSLSNFISGNLNSLEKTHKRFRKYIWAMKKDFSKGGMDTTMLWKDMRMLKMLQTIMVKAMTNYRNQRARIIKVNKNRLARKIKSVRNDLKSQEAQKMLTEKKPERQYVTQDSSIVKTEDDRENCPEYPKEDKPKDHVVNYFRPGERNAVRGKLSPLVGIRASFIRCQNHTDSDDGESKVFPGDIITRFRKRKLFCDDSIISDVRPMEDASGTDESWYESTYKDFIPSNRKYNVNMKRIKTLRSYNKSNSAEKKSN